MAHANNTIFVTISPAPTLVMFENLRKIVQLANMLHTGGHTNLDEIKITHPDNNIYTSRIQHYIGNIIK